MITTTTRIEANAITITTSVPIDAITEPIDIGALKSLAVKELGQPAKLGQPAILEAALDDVGAAETRQGRAAQLQALDELDKVAKSDSGRKK